LDDVAGALAALAGALTSVGTLAEPGKVGNAANKMAARTNNPSAPPNANWRTCIETECIGYFLGSRAAPRQGKPTSEGRRVNAGFSRREMKPR
jgi:hypothetical protein